MHAQLQKAMLMALYFVTDNPGALLRSFKKAIDAGHVATWEYDSQDRFIHARPQWRHQAYFSPVVHKRRLTFIISAGTAKPQRTGWYGTYHGRLIEAMINHCARYFSHAVATAVPTKAKK